MKINDLAFDSDAKEIVKISNLRCVLPHTDQAAFAASHAEGTASCQMEPHEAVALRVVGYANGRAVTGWTFRGVRAAALRPLTTDSDPFAKMPRRLSSYFVGRM